MTNVIHAADAPVGRRSPEAFYFRLSENAFRRLGLLLIPILLFALIGLRLATGNSAEYRAVGVLSAINNQLLDNQVTGNQNQVQSWETPAAGTSRLINERLTTDAFIKDIAADADLSDALESQQITTDDIREAVWASAEGSSLLSINATWTDAQTAFKLVNATIDSYSSYIADTVAAQSAAAVTFYEEQRADAQSDVDAAEAAFHDYVRGLAPVDRDEERPLEETIEIDRLSGALGAAEERVRSADEAIANAELVVQQSRSEAGRTLQVVDSPTLPTAPESTRFSSFITLFVFLVAGTIISGIILFVTTLLDRAVRSTADLDIDRAPANIAIVPKLGRAGRAKRPVASDTALRPAPTSATGLAS